LSSPICAATRARCSIGIAANWLNASTCPLRPAPQLPDAVAFALGAALQFIPQTVDLAQICTIAKLPGITLFRETAILVFQLARRHPGHGGSGTGLLAQKTDLRLVLKAYPADFASAANCARSFAAMVSWPSIINFMAAYRSMTWRCASRWAASAAASC
jgi:hypothetical protein